MHAEERVATPTRNSECRDEDVHQANKVEKVGGAMLPERAFTVDNALLPILPLLLHEECVMLLRL